MMRFLTFITAMSVLLITSCSVGATGGISLNRTRIVFTNEEKIQSLRVTNTAKVPYLIQSRIQYYPGDNRQTPFMITPPLIPVSAENKQLLRIFKQEGNLPDDRESLFYLTVLAIPAQKERSTENQGQTRLSMGVQFVIKLFYRPEKVKGLHEKDVCQLQFSRTEKGIRVDNSTPYYMTLGMLKINDQLVDFRKQPSMIAPMSSDYYGDYLSAKTIRWNIIDDVGGVSKECQQRL